MTIDVQYLGQLRTECVHIKSGSTLVTDAPTDNHGKGEKFSPTDLMGASLASCMITVMGIKAAERNIEFSNVSAEVQKVMVSNPRRISELNVVLRVAHDWSANERKLMERIARDCPVALSLHPDVKQGLKILYSSK